MIQCSTAATCTLDGRSSILVTLQWHPHTVPKDYNIRHQITLFDGVCLAWQVRLE